MPDQKDEGLVSSTDSPELMEPEEMSHSQRQNWLLNGSIPEKHDVTAKSSPPANGTQKSVKPAPESQPVKQQEQPKRAPNSAENRVKEVLNERKQLEARIKELEAKLTKPAESGVTQASPPARSAPVESGVTPAAPPVQSDDEPIPDKKPDGGAWKDWKEYQAAHNQWLIRESHRYGERQAQERAAQQSQQQLWNNWNERLRKTAEKHQDYAQMAQRAPVNEALIGYLFRSASGPEILYELGSMDPQQMKEFQSLDDYGKFQRVVEMEIERRPSRTRTPEPAVPQFKQTRTPPPSADIGARNSAPSDEGMAAVQNDDFRAFYNHETRKDIASRR